jgi:hypothetical protein
MKSALAFLISQSILLPLVFAVLRLKRLNPGYLPFFCQLAAGLLTEIVSFVLIKRFHTSNAIPANLFIGVEWLLVSWQFHRWGFLKNQPKTFYGLAITLVGVWILENLVFGKITVFGPYYRFFYSFAIIMLSVNKINFMIMYENHTLFKNPQFLISIGYIIFFLYKIIYEWAYQVSIHGSTGVTTNNIIYLFSYVNAFANLVFALAISQVPPHKKFEME